VTTLTIRDNEQSIRHTSEVVSSSDKWPMFYLRHGLLAVCGQTCGQLVYQSPDPKHRSKRHQNTPAQLHCVSKKAPTLKRYSSKL